MVEEDNPYDGRILSPEEVVEAGKVVKRRQTARMGRLRARRSSSGGVRRISGRSRRRRR